MANKAVNKENDKEYLKHLCGECARCEPYMKWETLTVKDRKPTMGICPEIKNRKVLLSEMACEKYKRKLL